MTSERTVSLVVVDDHPVVLRGFAAVLAAENDFQVCGTCQSATEGLQVINHLNPDIAVIDLALPDVDGLELLGMIRSQSPDTKVIIMTAEATNQQLLTAISRGASALLLKDAAMSELVQTVRNVNDGKRCFPSTLVEAALEHETGSSTSRFKLLSPRERAVMRLVMEGLPNKEVGRRLGLSEGTVKIHLHNMYQKTGVGNRTALTVFALAHQDLFAT